MSRIQTKTVLIFSWLGMVSSIALHLFAYLNMLLLDIDSRPLLFLLLPLIAGLPVTYMPAVYRDMNLTDVWHNKKYRWGRRRWGTLKEVARITLGDSPGWMQATAYQAIYVALGYSMLPLLGTIPGVLLVGESILPKLVLIAVTGLSASYYYFAVAIHTSALKAEQ